MFANRNEAARQLASRLQEYATENVVVVALARGAVPMGCALAEALNADLYVLVVRKIGAPGNRELAIGALSDGSEPAVWLNRELIDVLGVSDSYIEQAIKSKSEELHERNRMYGTDRRNPSLAGRPVILTDDGIATGATMKIALATIRKYAPQRIVLAVPVASRESVAELQPVVDHLVCLEQPTPFIAVGQHYRTFEQVDDGEVIRMISDFDRRRRRPPRAVGQ